MLIVNPANLTSPLWDVGDLQISLPRGPLKMITSTTRTPIQSIKMLVLSLARLVDVTFLRCTIFTSSEITNFNSIPGDCSQGLQGTISLNDQP